jgi:ABC-type nitrate/sulfonate/bicarbonate transport system permease component
MLALARLGDHARSSLSRNGPLSNGRTGTFALRLRSIGLVAVILIVWELATRAKLAPPLFLPSFTSVVEQLARGLGEGTLLSDLGLSLFRAGTGLALATLIGVLAGIVMARSRFLHWLLDPVIALAFPSPKIAFIPVFILWFGIYSLSKILLVAFACVFPIIIGTYSAALAVNRFVVWSALSMGTSRALLLFRVILPACYPRIFAALRVAVPVALITTFTAEMVAGGGGMGASLMYAQRFFESPTVFAYILTMLIVGLALDLAMLQVRDRLPAWRDEDR